VGPLLEVVDAADEDDDRGAAEPGAGDRHEQL